MLLVFDEDVPTDCALGAKTLHSRSLLVAPRRVERRQSPLDAILRVCRLPGCYSLELGVVPVVPGLGRPVAPAARLFLYQVDLATERSVQLNGTTKSDGQ